jgi:hypothetical protein
MRLRSRFDPERTSGVPASPATKWRTQEIEPSSDWR